MDWDGSYGPYLIAAGALYLLGAIAVTIVFNVPRNDALARLKPDRPEAATLWARYLVEWTAWNHVRTVAPLIAAGLEIAGLYVGGRESLPLFTNRTQSPWFLNPNRRQPPL